MTLYIALRARHAARVSLITIKRCPPTVVINGVVLNEGVDYLDVPTHQGHNPVAVACGLRWPPVSWCIVGSCV